LIEAVVQLMELMRPCLELMCAEGGFVGLVIVIVEFGYGCACESCHFEQWAHGGGDVRDCNLVKWCWMVLRW
jgi:hypothetical protein